MWVDELDARSDFVLAIAPVIVVPIAFSFVQPVIAPLPALLQIPLYLTVPILSYVAMPVFLARYRERGLSAFGYEAMAWSSSYLLIIAIVVALWVFVSGDRSPGLVDLLGVFGPQTQSATVQPASVTELVASPLSADMLIILTVSLLQAVSFAIFFPFLIVASRDAWRGVTVSQMQALRTFGMGAAGVALVIALLTLLTGAAWQVLLPPLAIVALVLVADRSLVSGTQTTRATLLAPTAAVVITTGGGIFGLLRSDNPAQLLFFLALHVGVVFVVGSLIESKRGAMGVLVLAAALALYPLSVLNPISL